MTFQIPKHPPVPVHPDTIQQPAQCPARGTERACLGTEKDWGLWSVKGDCEYVRPYQVMVRCNDVKIRMEVDTGAARSLISEKLYKRRFKKWKPEPSEVCLKTYSAEPIPLLGKFKVKVQCGDQTQHLVLLVSKGNGPALMGRN